MEVEIIKHLRLIWDLDCTDASDDEIIEILPSFNTSIEDLVSKIEIGVKNGYTIEEQFKIISYIWK